MKSWGFIGGPDSVTYRLYDWVRQRLNHRLASYLAKRALPGVALEAGAGTAFATSILRRQPGVFAVALDVDAEPLQEALKRDPGLTVVIGSLYNLPFKDGSCDLVWNNSTMEHLDDQGSALAEMQRVAAVGGHVFVGVPYRWGPLGFQPWVSGTPFGVWLGPVASGRELRQRIKQARLVPLQVLRYGWRCFLGVLAEKC